MLVGFFRRYSGLREWILQRLSALVILLVALPIVRLWIAQPGADYQAWHGLLTQTWMRYGLAFALLSVLIHAWIGLKTVTGDYVKCRYADYMILLILLGLGVWGAVILWSAGSCR